MAGLRLKIDQHGLHPSNCRVWLDGNEITNGLTGLSVTWGIRDVTRAELSINLDELEVDTETMAALAAHVKDDDGGEA